ITTFAGIDVFAATWWVAAVRGHLDVQSSVGVAAVATGLITAPLGWWAAQPEPGSSQADPVGPRPDHLSIASGAAGQQIRVDGLVPGQAVEFQDRLEILDRLTVLAGQGPTTVICGLAGQRGI